VTQPCV